MTFSQIQTKFTSIVNPSNIANFDIEYVDVPTQTLIHSTARFLYIKKGKGTIAINGIEYVLQPNVLIAIMAWDITTITSVLEPLQFIKLAYNHSFINSYLRTIYNPTSSEISLFADISNQPVVILDALSTHELNHCLTLLKNEIGDDTLVIRKADKAVLSNSYVVALIIQIHVIFSRCEHRQDIVVSENVELNNINDILRYIYAHVSEKITLEKIAAVFFMSESTIRRHFEQNLGYSFSELVNAMRISKVVDLLMYTNFNLDQIAELVGFTDASHLTKAFSADKQMTPNTFRDNYKNTQSFLKHKEQNISFNLLNFVDQHSNDPNLTALGVCKEFDISLRELNHITQFYVEKSFSEYLDWIRVAKAANLLLNYDYTITYIAMEVGYNSTKTFQRAFTKITKFTPNDFRKQVHFQSITGEVIQKK